MKALLLAVTLAALTIACTGSGDDTTVPIDAPSGDIDSTSGGPDGPAGIDAPGACVLPTTPTTCTGDPQCQALCGTAYCYNFMMIGMRCTMACTAGGNECPAGWSCNGMGRCRPPN